MHRRRSVGATRYGDLRLDPPAVLEASAVVGRDGGSIVNVRFADDLRLGSTVALASDDGPLVLHDDGAAGDAMAGDRIYAAALAVPFAQLQAEERRVLADLARRGVTQVPQFDGPEIVAERTVDPGWRSSPVRRAAGCSRRSRCRTRRSRCRRSACGRHCARTDPSPRAGAASSCGQYRRTRRRCTCSRQRCTNSALRGSGCTQPRRRAAPRGILHRSRSRSRRRRYHRTGNAGPAAALRRRPRALPCSSCHWPGRSDRRARGRSEHTPRRLLCTRRPIAMPPRCTPTEREPSIADRAGCTVAHPRSPADRTPGSRAARPFPRTRRAASPSRRSRTGSSCIASSEVVVARLRRRARSSPDPVIAGAGVFDRRAGLARSLVLNTAAWIAATCEMSRASERRK